MRQAWHQSSGMQTHAEGMKDAHERGTAPGKGQAGGPGEFMQSGSEGLGPAGQQNHQLLLTPASLQLAHLQAQLTLQRLKLVQGGAASSAAATVLNQVLSNVAMSQPLFNQTSSGAAANPPRGGGFPAGVLGFPAPGPTLGTLVGGRFNPGTGARQNSYGPGAVCPRGPGDYGHKAGSHSDKRYAAGGAQASNNTNSAGFRGDFYGQGHQQAGFSAAEQNLGAYSAAGHKEHWEGPPTQGPAGEADGLPGGAWTAPGQPLRTRAELYNPEEPTSDPKFNPGGSGNLCFGPGVSTQGFVGYQPVQGVNGPLSSGSTSLQPNQVKDYHAVTPTHLPHQCTICDKKVYNLKDWDQHVKGKLHLQNRSLYAIEGPAVVTAGPVHYAVSGSSCEGGQSNSMVYSAPTQDASSAASVSYLQAATMTTYPMSNAGFASHQTGSKPFPPRKSTPGRVVHICNLPEGSCTENDVINLGLPFGKVTNYILMRSTHQAFLEMAYVEAAQAMVQYYQLSPATISDQKLLIRMSKRYKELQLKKPGKDVESIIQDIHSQRERDEIQELDHYMIPERARSRSPISRSLSPRSHSPSFTSCSSAHSPQGAPCRGPDRSGNGAGPRGGSWDWSSHLRRAEEDRERERDELLWRNGGGAEDERPNGRVADRGADRVADRVADRRKPFPKPADRVSPRSADERGGGGIRSNRDWFPRGSPQGSPFGTYRNMEEEFYVKEQMYKMEKPPRPPYQRHEAKARRREGEHHGRSRHSEVDTHSPARGRSRTSSRHHHIVSQKIDGQKATQNNDRQLKDKSPQRSRKQSDATACEKDRDSVEEWVSGEDTEGECWYPRNMEELVTVDEVGEEDDSIIEPDLPELAEEPSSTREPAEDVLSEVYTEGQMLNPEGQTLNPEGQTLNTEGQTLNTEGQILNTEGQTIKPEGQTFKPEGQTLKPEGQTLNPEGQTINPEGQTIKPEGQTLNPEGQTLNPEGRTLNPEGQTLNPEGQTLNPEGQTLNPEGRTLNPEGQTLNPEGRTLNPEGQTLNPEGQTLNPEGRTLTPVAADLQSSQLSNFPGQEFKAALEEACSEDKGPSYSPAQEPMVNHVSGAAISQPQEVEPVTEANNEEQQHKEETLETDIQSTIRSSHPNQTEIVMPAPFREQDKVISEHSIPLGVEFIVPRTGFYCKLCGLFYTSEETAKSAHCRSTIHYRNLQKYLSQLAEESLLGALTERSTLE